MPGSFYRYRMSLSSQSCLRCVVAYTGYVPKLWNETIEAHRAAVRHAIQETTAALVAEHGLASVTMSQIAEADRHRARDALQVLPGRRGDPASPGTSGRSAGHLEQLAEVRDRPATPPSGSKRCSEAYALITHEHHGTELAALLHRGAHVVRAHQHLREFIRDLVAEGAAAGRHPRRRSS